MPAFAGTLKPEELDLLVDFLVSRKAPPPVNSASGLQLAHALAQQVGVDRLVQDVTVLG
jgi:hypothetical protein